MAFTFELLIKLVSAEVNAKEALGRKALLVLGNVPGSMFKVLVLAQVRDRREGDAWREVPLEINLKPKDQHRATSHEARNRCNQPGASKRPAEQTPYKTLSMATCAAGEWMGKNASSLTPWFASLNGGTWLNPRSCTT